MEIVAADGAFYLLYLDEDDNYMTDGWHQTLAQAKAQAQREFAIRDDEWEDLDVH